MKAPALAVFVTSLAILATEVFYTRLFSILLWSNIAFAVLSLALLGLGSSGLVVFLFPQVFRRDRAEEQVTWLLPATGWSLLASYQLVLWLTRSPVDQWVPVLGLVELILVAMLPYFAGGLVLAIVFTHFAEQIAKLYFWDLVGAALGATLVVPALYLFNGPALLPAVALVLAAGGAAYGFRRGRARARESLIWWSLVSCLAFVLILAVPEARQTLAVRQAKGAATPNIQLERWDPLARITVSPGPDERTRFLTMDGGAVSAVLRFDGDFERVSFLKGNVLQLAYHLRNYESSLIIGPGGGSDVLASLVFGNRNITAVEVNQSTLDIVRDDLRAFSGGVYELPGVDAQVGEGRAFVTGLEKKFDLIQATFIDTWVAASTGSHTLSEDYLYTVEGIRVFLDHLHDDGVFSMSRWGGPLYGYLETYRVVGIANQVLRDLGVAEPARHIMVVQGPPPERVTQGGGYQTSVGSMESMSTILVKRSPFDEAEIGKIEQVSRDLSFQPLWLAGRGEDRQIAELFASRGADSYYTDYYEKTGLDFSPITDDRPFFFDMIRPQDYLRMKDKLPGVTAYGRMYTAIQVLYQLMIAMLIVVIALLGVPLLVRTRPVPLSRPVAEVMAFFVCLGLGFIGIELGLIQKFALFLGHPVYSLVVLLASILLFSGIGSFSAARISPKAGFWRALVLLAVLLLYSVVIRPLTQALIASPFPIKCAIAVALSALPAFLMGTFFPLGVAVARERFPALIPWGWAINSGFSVLGGTLSLFASMSWGYARTWYAFTLPYFIAAILLRRMASDTFLGERVPGGATEKEAMTAELFRPANMSMPQTLRSWFPWMIAAALLAAAGVATAVRMRSGQHDGRSAPARAEASHTIRCISAFSRQVHGQPGGRQEIAARFSGGSGHRHLTWSASGGLLMTSTGRGEAHDAGSGFLWRRLR